MQVPTEFLQAIERLYLEAESLLALEEEQVGDDDRDLVTDRLETLIEESIHLLSADHLRFVTELQLLS